MEFVKPNAVARSLAMVGAAYPDGALDTVVVDTA